MTQAFNLSQLANNVNTSGQLDATDGLVGLVDNSNLASSGTASSSTYLRGDRTWASVPAGTVTSVTISAGAGLTGGGTITSSGTITLALETNYQAIGTYILASTTATGVIMQGGNTISGANLWPAGNATTQSFVYGGTNNNTYYASGDASAMTAQKTTFSGTWQLMGAGGPPANTQRFTSLFVRIS